MAEIKVANNVNKSARTAWEETLAETGSPAMALKAAKATNTQNLGYLPHQGKKEIQRRLNKLNKKQELV